MIRLLRLWGLPLFAGAAVAILAYLGVLWATPGFIMDRAWHRLTERGPANAILHAPLATAEARTIVRPSPDLAYSICPLDLSKGSVAIHVEPVPGHYWSLTIFDDRTNAAYVASDRESGGKAIDVIVGRSDADVVLPGDKGVALVRILLKGREDFAVVDAVRRRSSCGAIKPARV